MTTQSISIALATYNGSRFIEEQLQSLARQALLPAELIITDDASTDNTVEKVRQFTQQAPFPVSIYVNEERLGYQNNFLKAVSLCSSDLIAFCDQDDRWRPNKLAVMERAMRDPDVLVACHNADVVDDAGTFLRLQNPWETVDRKLSPMEEAPWKFAAGFTQVFRRGLLAFTHLNKLSYDPNSENRFLAHDQWVSLLGCLGTQQYIGESLVDYRQHGGNVCGASSSTDQSLLEKLHLKIEDRSRLYHRLQRSSEANANIFDLISKQEGVSEVYKRRAAEVGSRWSSLSRLYALRARAYMAPSVSERSAAIAGLIKLNGYNDKDIWSYGKKSLVRDILLGVMAGPLVARSGAPKSLIDSSVRSLKPLA